MGLAERRAAERFKDDVYPTWKAKIDEVAGFDVPVEVMWDELAAADYADSYDSFFPKVYFQPMVDALAAITVDEMGKTALRDRLKKVVVRNTERYSSTSGLSFDGGVLMIDHKPYSNVDYGADRTSGLRKLLESSL